MSDLTSVFRAPDGKERSRGLEWEIAELAERQHGVVGRSQLLDLGMGRGAIEGRLARGWLHRIYAGVYAVGRRSLDRRGRWMAAVLSAGPAAVLSHRSAAQLWGLLPPSSQAPEVTRSTRFHSRERLRAHCSLVREDEIAIVERIPVTSVPRTILDLASDVSRRAVENALNAAEVRQLRDALSIPDLLERYPRRPGSAMLRELVGDGVAAGVTRSSLEERFAALLATTDLPRPRLNANIAIRDRFFEVDCLWAEQRVIVELDGRDTHATRRAFERDRERDRLLLVDGWRVVRITWRQLDKDAAAIVADLRRVLRLQARRPTL
jgi:very-short-patch-repair endonuclease/predicted transcriptional regulator of viral defense system